jgi:hypothetical protein
MKFINMIFRAFLIIIGGIPSFRDIPKIGSNLKLKKFLNLTVYFTLFTHTFYRVLTVQKIAMEKHHKNGFHTRDNV